MLEAILEQAHVEYPPVMLANELDEVVREVEGVVKREARLSLEDYLRIQNQTMEQLREELEPRAAARLKRALVLGEVVRLEGLEVDEDEIDARIEAISAAWGERSDDARASLKSDDGQRTVYNRLLADKAIRRLITIAKGEAPEPASVEETEDQETGQAESEES